MNYEQELTEFETWLNQSRVEKNTNDWKIIIEVIKRNFDSNLRKITRIDSDIETLLKLQPSVKKKEDLSFDTCYRILWSHQRVFWVWESLSTTLTDQSNLIKTKLKRWTKLLTERTKPA